MREAANGQPRDRFTRVDFRHHKASEASRQRANFAAANSGNGQVRSGLSSYAASLKVS